METHAADDAGEDRLPSRPSASGLPTPGSPPSSRDLSGCDVSGCKVPASGASDSEGPDAAARWRPRLRRRLVLLALGLATMSLLTWAVWRHLPHAGPVPKGLLAPDPWQDASTWGWQRMTFVAAFALVAAASWVPRRAVRGLTRARALVIGLVDLGLLVACAGLAVDWWFVTGHGYARWVTMAAAAIAVALGVAELWRAEREERA